MRKLAIAALSFSAAIFAANYILPLAWLLPVAALLALTAAVVLRAPWKRKKLVAAVLIFTVLGLLCYRYSYRVTQERAEELAGQSREMRLRLVTYPVSYDSYVRAEAVAVDEGFPKGRVLVYDKTRTIADAIPGQLVYAAAELSTADTLYGKSYDNYNSKDIFLKANIDAVPILYGGYDRRCIPAYFAHFCSERVRELFPEDTAAFMCSLMLGDKSELYDNEPLYADMTRAGLMHIVAVSGLHVAYLVGFLQLILGRSRRSSILCILLVWGFTLAAGAPPSAVRAAFMQTMLLIAPIIYRENDPITSLSLALALILLVNPIAARNIGLQLSFGSMAGIVLFSDKIYHRLRAPFAKRRYRVLNYLLGALSGSIAVSVFTLPLTAIHFGYLAVLSVLANIAVLWCVSLCFCGGWISCLLSAIPTLGTAAAWLCSWLARYIFAVAGWISDVPFALVYVETPGAVWWMLGTCLLLLLSMLSEKYFWLCLSAAVLTSASSLALLLHSERAEYLDGPGTMTVLNVGQGQCLVAMAGDATLMVDCGSTSGVNADEVAAEYLISRGRKRIDLLVLTHLHDDHVNAVPMLMERIRVGSLLLSADADRTKPICREIIEAAERNGTELILQESGKRLRLGDIKLHTVLLSHGDDENENCLAGKLSIGETDMLFTADCSFAGEYELIRSMDVRGVELLVAGHHGSKYSCSKALLHEIGGHLAVVSADNQRYGQPAEETLERLENNGYVVWRTDLDGTAEFRIGRNNG